MWGYEPEGVHCQKAPHNRILTHIFSISIPSVDRIAYDWTEILWFNLE